MATTPAEEPPDYRYFRDKSGDAETVFAAVTNWGLYGPDTGNYGIDKEPDDLYRDPVGANTERGTELSGFGGTFDRENSGVSWVGAVTDILGEELTEEEARNIHPRLLNRIEQ